MNRLSKCCMFVNRENVSMLKQAKDDEKKIFRLIKIRGAFYSCLLRLIARPATKAKEDEN